jgi:protocatechuate 3,4-dioxygenase, beta subunit
MMPLMSILLIATLLFVFNPPSIARGTGQRLPECEWCGAGEVPADVSWLATIAGKDEPGERLVVRGRVYRPDGKTPAPGVILYAYHTNAKGVYPKKGTETGNARRHGYLRGWMKTDSTGRYEFRTIRPAAYPGGENPQHIHVTVKEPGRAEYWIDEFHFDDDPLLTPEQRSRLRNRGGSGIIRPTRGDDGAFEAVRDITLPE